MRLNTKQIATITGGVFQVESMDSRELVTGISWDSREIVEGDMYVALPGERVDGHAFVAPALRAGAVAALVSMPVDRMTVLLAQEMGAAIIEVPNTASALTDLARAWRKELKGRVIGLTGSTGKTTTKGLVRDVLAARGSVVATIGNQNNELGVPRTILTANPETDAVVVEMGMRGLDQLHELCEFVRPDCGLVTNTGECHIELLGSRENIVLAKSELLQDLPAGIGKAFVNDSDDMVSLLCEYGKTADRDVETIRFGIGEPSVSDGRAVWADGAQLDEQGRPQFMLCARGFDHLANVDESGVAKMFCQMELRGMHNVSNACSAAAVGFAMGMQLEDVVAALQSSLPESGRQEVIKARAGYTVINDAYNANPDSMKASLKMFCSMDVSGKRYAVLGDMAELGDYAPACHRGVGTQIASLPVDVLICIGELSEYIAAAAEEAGYDSDRIVRARSISDVLGELDVRLEKGDVVLVKASHSIGLERVVEGLVR